MTSVSQVPFVAAQIAEPNKDSRIVDMLECLPIEESKYYASECNVTHGVEVCPTLLQEITQRYNFLGGDYTEWVAYLNRPDLPPMMWKFVTEDEVQTDAGVSAVAKKEPGQLRKLIMSCPANYCMQDVRARRNHGLGGSSALGKVLAWEPETEAALLDESNAFTSVLTPSWLWKYMACPRVAAADVWTLLPADLRSKVKPWTLVAPLYQRLPMGCSHSVHILMSINLHTIGQALIRNFRPTCDWDKPPSEIAPQAIVTNKEAVAPPPATPIPSRSRLMQSPQAFRERARRAKSLNSLTVVALHAFGGSRREGDMEESFNQWSQTLGIVLLFETADLAFNSEWDLGNPHTIQLLLEMISTGLLDILIGGPPCATWSRVRFVPGGPRPLRFRGRFAWGRHDLTTTELASVTEANLLMINFLALCTALVKQKGTVVFEHPKDPEEEPMPSIFATPEFQQFLDLPGMILDIIDQCMYGGPTQKGTGIAHNCPLLSKGTRRCDGQHSHGRSTGLDLKGIWHSRRLQNYPPAMNQWIAWGCLSWVRLHEDYGSTGAWLRSLPSRNLWSWNGSSKEQLSMAVLNENFIEGSMATISQHKSATYLHVDDGVFLTHPKAAPASAELMNTAADALVDIGFKVTDRRPPTPVQKMLGFHLCQHPARLEVPILKVRLIADTMLWLANHWMADTRLIRSVLGMWIWAASLRRELLSVPASIFKFIDVHWPRRVPWWPSAKEEFRHMAALSVFMSHKLYRPTTSIIFASDAEGSNNEDFGGFGVVGAKISEDQMRQVFEAGTRPGMTVAKMDGSLTHKFGSAKEILARIPISNVPKEVLQESRSWLAIAAGRWKHHDHITLGEGRGSMVLLQKLADIPQAHGGRYASLCDNMPWCGMVAKGRSPAFRCNRLLRKRAGLTLAADISLLHPWVDTLRMPADWLSRHKL